MKFGCHAVMFAGNLLTDMEGTIKAIKSTGFRGIECGNRFIPLDQQPRLLSLLEAEGLELAAMMYGYVNWEADPKTGWDGLRKQAEFTGKYFPNKRLNVSFIPDEQVDCRKMAEVFNEAANICNFYGVSLNYHNHLSEFANRGKFIYTLLDTAPSLNFAYDLGWVCRAGFDPLKLLEDTGKRCTYVHLRDPKTERAEAFTLEAMKALPLFPDFGTGETDLQSQIDYLKNHFGPDDWAVVEHEGGEPDVQRYIRAKEVINRLCTIH